MANKKVLIITHTADNSCIDNVVRFIEEAGAEAIRFNVDRYPIETRLTTSFVDNRWTTFLQVDNDTYHLEDITAVWYRRSHSLGKGLQQIIDPEYLPATIGEVKHTFVGMLEGLTCFQLERFSVYRRLDSKEEQLKVASANGLLIPATCISNDPVQVQKFIKQQHGPVITKMQSSFAIYREKQEHVVFTNEITVDQLDDLDMLQYCPMVFQQRIEKKLELRITIVGDAVFAFSIDSQRVDNAKVDWRKEGASMIEEWEPYTLPEPVQKKLLAFMDSYGLNYGAIDVIVTPNDDYYFLEVNAAGEYFWLDRICDHAISRHIAAVLLGDVPRRE
jgi:hypothetical protein